MKKDILNLRSKIKGKDLVLFDEIVKCFDAKAYRAAFLMTWIGIAESIKMKLEEMGKRDDVIAKEVGKIKSFEEQEKPTDRLLLDSANKYGFITDDEKLKLSQILNMRGVYAHPYGVAASKEEVIAALVVATEVIFSRPPLLRHGYVKQILTSLFENRHYIDDVEEKINEYANSISSRINPQVNPYLLENLMKRLEEIAGDPEMLLFQKRGICFTEQIIKVIKPNLLDDETWGVEGLISKYPRASSRILRDKDIWQMISENAKDSIFGLLLEPIINGTVSLPSIRGLSSLLCLEAAGLLTVRQKERLEYFINNISCAGLTILAGAKLSLNRYCDKIINYLESHNWYCQNPAAEVLAIAGPVECNTLSEDKQILLGRNIYQATDGGSGGAGKFLDNLKTKNDWPEKFNLGLLLEAFINENHKFRIKDEPLTSMLPAIFNLPAETIVNLFDELIKEIGVVDVTDLYFSGNEYDKAKKTINDLSSHVANAEIANSTTSLHKAIEALIEKNKVPF